MIRRGCKVIRKGSKVKVEDVGPLCTCIREGKHQIEVELDGEVFWILKRLCKPV